MPASDRRHNLLGASLLHIILFTTQYTFYYTVHWLLHATLFTSPYTLYYTDSIRWITTHYKSVVCSNQCTVQYTDYYTLLSLLRNTLFATHYSLSIRPPAQHIRKKFWKVNILNILTHLWCCKVTTEVRTSVKRDLHQCKRDLCAYWLFRISISSSQRSSV